VVERPWLLKMVCFPSIEFEDEPGLKKNKLIMFFGRDFPTRIYERWRLCEVGEHQRAAIAVPRFFFAGG